MIYILGKDNIDKYDEVGDIVIIVSTDVDDILNYAYNNIEIRNFYDYTLLIVPENDDYLGASFTPNSSIYNQFINYAPKFLLEEENKEEYEHIKLCMKNFCDAVELKTREENERLDRLKKEKQEQEERKLYEKLKAKYGE